MNNAYVKENASMYMKSQHYEEDGLIELKAAGPRGMSNSAMDICRRTNGGPTRFCCWIGGGEYLRGQFWSLVVQLSLRKLASSTPSSGKEGMGTIPRILYPTLVVLLLRQLTINKTEHRTKE